MAVQHEHWISPEEYLQIDRASPDIKYEYVDGHMYAMSGGTIEHAQIAMNMIRALADHLQGSSCRVISSDVRVQVAEKKYFYPDVTVSCAPEDRQRGVDTIRTPRLVVEVLSPTTETNDRVQKFRFYKACPSIQEGVRPHQYPIPGSRDISSPGRYLDLPTVWTRPAGTTGKC